MGRLVFRLMLIALLWATAACSGDLVSRTVQQGGTVLIPFAGTSRGIDFGGGVPIGYGGRGHTDYQRGMMVFRLGGPTGHRLETVGTSAVLPHPAAPDARQADSGDPNATGIQYFSVVHVQSAAPVGIHQLHVSREDIPAGGGTPVETAIGLIPQNLEILEGSYDVDNMGTIETIVGKESRVGGFLGAQFFPNEGFVPSYTPDPQIRVQLSAPVWAVEFDLQYPAATIDVVDAIPFFGQYSAATAATYHDYYDQQPVVWFEDQAGTVRISAVATEAAFDAVAIVFQLDDGTVDILEPADVGTSQITIVSAYGQNGEPVTVTPSQTAIW